jgi:hypothetical protein
MDLNDPLGDILSEDSDDSFFNDDKYKSTKTKSHQIVNIEAKKSDLFGLTEEPKSSTIAKLQTLPSIQPEVNKPKHDWLGLGKSDSATPIFFEEEAVRNELKSVSNITKEPPVLEKLNFLDELDLSEINKRKSRENLSKESFSLDDLLGKKSQTPIKISETVTSSGYTPSVSVKSVARKIDKPIGSFKVKPELKEVSRAELEKSTPTIEASKRQKSKDWLGLFGDESDNMLTEAKKEKSTKFSDLLKEESTPIDIKSTKVVDDRDDRLNESFPNEYKHIQMDFNNLAEKLVPNIDMGVNIEQQSATLCLQQQESHLMVALQLKSQEERLVAMQGKVHKYIYNICAIF